MLVLLVLAGCASGGKVPSGHYRVQRGDTLTQIARDNNTTVAALVRWNQLANSHQIETGQVLRVTPPPGGARGSSASPATRGAAGTAPKAGRPAAPPRAVRSPPVGDIKLAWPAPGQIVRRYDGSKSLGVAIANTAGTPITAAAAGTVAYASNGLRGYGNLIIIRHGGDYLTIYAHNRRLLVKQGQRVKQGETIAEMGNSDSERVQLYFELRRGGQAVDPTQALPPR